MSNRETEIQSSIQKWRGVDQRIQPTLVQDGFFSMSRGVFFGLGDNAERLPGKVLTLLMTEPIFSITVAGNNLLIQTLSKLWLLPLADLSFQVEEFTWSSNGDTNGIAYFFGTNFGQSSWSNPVTAGSIVCSSTAIFTGTVDLTLDRTTGQLIIDNNVNNFIKWDFGDHHSIKLTDYTLRGRSNFSGDINPRNWKIQGSNNNLSWTDLDIRVNDASVGPGAATWAHFSIPTTARYRYLRMLQTGLNAAGNNYLVLSEIEFYGTLYF